MKNPESRIKVCCDLLKSQICLESVALDKFEFVESGYKTSNTPPKDGWKAFDRSTVFSEEDKHFWFRSKIRTPKIKRGQQVKFSLRTGCEGQWSANNPQCLVYLDGKMTQALDTNHNDVLLESNTSYELLIYFYTGNFRNGKSKELSAGIYFLPSLNIVDRRIENLYWDLFVPLEAIDYMEPHGSDRAHTIRILEEAANCLDLRQAYSTEYYKGILDATKLMANKFYNGICGKNISNVTVDCIGHTHIDVAWLWPVRQTVEKAQRSFAGMLQLMKQYPEFKFMSSQPQLYSYVKEQAPEIYEEIKQRVREGRWEVEGAMWLEADCNLISGESIVRQILHGKRFINEEFAVDSQVLWLPDVFGYSAALPQILQKCGVPYFVTSKISWNDHDKLPVDSFIWQGIDGSEVFATFLTAQDADKNISAEPKRGTTYNAKLSPKQVMGTYRRYQQKEYSDATLMTFGFGDGGGGTTYEMLENYRRLSYGLPGFPKVKMSFALDYIKRAEREFLENSKLIRRTPKWVGELYLEFHRGTYTSQANNKKGNRKCEQLLQRTEALSATAMLLNSVPYPKNELNKAWEKLLLNQFHDILPGSSIHEVYEDSARDYNDIRESVGAIEAEKIENIAQNIKTKGGLLIYNPLGFARKGTVRLGGKSYMTPEIPAMGWSVVKQEQLTADEGKVVVSGNTLENEFFKITLDKAGRIASLFDKRAAREVIKKDEFGNEIQIFEDLPPVYDAWEIANYYKSKCYILSDDAQIKPIFDGTRAGFSIEHKYMQSTIRQNMWLYESVERIDFETEIDWKEEHQIIKAAFPIDVNSAKAAYEIQFGSVERETHENTSWDAAKFEVCAHKWADISENGYGVSLLNDCKYGYNAEGSTLKLTLLKSATYPDPDADKGKHSFVYSLYPHKKSWRNGTVREAYSLNVPLMQKELAKQDGALPSKFSLVSAEHSNIIIDTVKKAEDSDDIIVRLYDAHNRRENTTVSFGFDIESVYICDMLENNQLQLQHTERTVVLPVKGYEIVTLKVTPKK